METAKLKQRTNRLRQQLNSENALVFEEVVEYLRSSPINTKKTEEILAELLDHLIELEQIGKTSKDLFGENVHGYCRQLVKSLHRDTFIEKLNFALLIVALSAIFELVFAFINGVIDWRLSTAHLICNLFFAQLAFWTYQKIDRNSDIQKKIYYFAFSTLFIIIYVALGLVLSENR